MFESRLRSPDCSDTIGAMLATLAGDAVSDATRHTIEAHAAQAPADVVLGVYDFLLRTSDDELLAMAQGLMDKIRRAVPADPRCRTLAGVHGVGGRSAFRGVTIEVWPESGHFLHLADPERFVRRVLRLHL